MCTTLKNNKSIVRFFKNGYFIFLTFLALFPGFFFYHTLLGLSVVPPFLGSFFAPVSAVVFLVSLVFYIRNVAFLRKSWNLVDYLFFGLMAYIVWSAFFFYAAKPGFGGGRDILMWSLVGVFLNLLNYMLAKTIVLNKPRQRKILFAVLFLMLVVALSNINDQGIFYLKSNSDNPEVVATYQGFARSIAIVSLFLIALENRFWMFFVTSIAAACVLFLNGARSEFLTFLLAVVGVFLIRFEIKKNILQIFYVVCLCCVVALFFMFGLIGFDFQSNRVLDLFSGENSSSTDARIYLQDFALASIAENPILGDYGSYLHLGGTGFYSHNLLSAWVNLGLLGFLLYLLVFFVVFRTLVFGRLLIDSIYPYGALAFGLAVFCLLSMLLAKDYSYMFFGMMVGFCSRFQTEGALHLYKKSTKFKKTHDENLPSHFSAS